MSKSGLANFRTEGRATSTGKTISPATESSLSLGAITVAATTVAVLYSMFRTDGPTLSSRVISDGRSAFVDTLVVDTVSRVLHFRVQFGAATGREAVSPATVSRFVIRSVAKIASSVSVLRFVLAFVPTPVVGYVIRNRATWWSSSWRRCGWCCRALVDAFVVVVRTLFF